MISEYPKVYTHSLNDAIMSGEQSEWRESYHLNCHCAVDIERAIDDHYDGMRLDGGCHDIQLPKQASMLKYAVIELSHILGYNGIVSAYNIYYGGLYGTQSWQKHSPSAYRTRDHTGRTGRLYRSVVSGCFKMGD